MRSRDLLIIIYITLEYNLNTKQSLDCERSIFPSLNILRKNIKNEFMFNIAFSSDLFDYILM